MNAKKLKVRVTDELRRMNPPRDSTLDWLAKKARKAWCSLQARRQRSIDSGDKS